MRASAPFALRSVKIDTSVPSVVFPKACWVIWVFEWDTEEQPRSRPKPKQLATPANHRVVVATRPLLSAQELLPNSFLVRMNRGGWFGGVPPLVDWFNTLVTFGQRCRGCILVWLMFVVACGFFFDGRSLPVISLRAVLASEMFLQQYTLHRLGRRQDAQGLAGQPDQVLQDNGVMHCFVDAHPPGERAMICHQHRRTVQGIASQKSFDDDLARVGFVLRGDFAGPQATRARDRAVEIIRMRGAQRRHRATGLRPSRRKQAVGVDDAAYIWKSTV